MEIALCIVAATYLAFAFRDMQSFLYIAGVSYMLHMFINNPGLFSNGSATTVPPITTSTTDNTAHLDQQAPVAPSHKQLSPTAATPSTTGSRTATLPTTFTRSSQSTTPTVQRKPSRYTFDPINGGVVHFPFGSPKQTTPSTLPSPSGLKRSHRVPDVSAGRSPILPVLSVSPDSYLPNEQHESYPMAQAEVASRIVHTEMVEKPKLTLETEQALPAKKSLHRRVGSHHHRHHHSNSHSNSHSYHRRRISRSPMLFSDATAAGSGDQDYDSDSSHASTSYSSISSLDSCGLPSYEKHVRCWRHRFFVLL